MKSIKSLLPARNVAAAIVGIGLAASAMGQIGGGLTPNRLGTPNDGMICRSGYSGAMSGSAFKCSKARTVQVSMKCPNPQIGTYVVRAAGAADSAAGNDICTRNGVSVGSTDSLQGLVQGKDYVYVIVDTDEVAQKTARADEAEASALGLANGEVETEAGTPRVVPSARGSRDMADVVLTHYSFAIKTGGINTASR